MTLTVSRSKIPLRSIPDIDLSFSYPILRVGCVSIYGASAKCTLKTKYHMVFKGQSRNALLPRKGMETSLRSDCHS